jgi:RimJ/RimL family protein N-acetyltransferase
MLETDRLVIRPFVASDAGFIVELVNDPAWLRYIGDRNIRSLDDAARYIENGPRAMYRRAGFGLWLVALRDGTPIGMCGLVRRDDLDDVDLGFALLPRYRRSGYAFEAAQRVLEHGRRALRLARIVAISVPANVASINLLRKLGFAREKTIVRHDELVDLYAYAPPEARA